MFLLVDENSRKSWVMLLKNKAKARYRLREWKALVVRTTLVSVPN